MNSINATDLFSEYFRRDVALELIDIGVDSEILNLNLKQTAEVWAKGNITFESNRFLKISEIKILEVKSRSNNELQFFKIENINLEEIKKDILNMNKAIKIYSLENK